MAQFVQLGNSAHSQKYYTLITVLQSLFPGEKSTVGFASFSFKGLSSPIPSISDTYIQSARAQLQDLHDKFAEALKDKSKMVSEIKREIAVR